MSFKIITDDINNYFKNNKFTIANSKPLEGKYNEGDIVISNNQTNGELIGWICVVSGSPGEWEEIGNIQKEYVEQLIANTYNDIKQLETRVNVLQENDGNLDLSIFATKEMANEINKSIADINSDIRDLENKNLQVNDTIQVLENTLNGTQEDIEGIYDIIGDTAGNIRNDVNNIMLSNANLTTQINTLNSKINALEQKVQADIDQLTYLQRAFANSLISKGINVNLASGWDVLFGGLIDLIESGWCVSKDDTGTKVDCSSITISGISTSMNIGTTQTPIITVLPVNCAYSSNLVSSNQNILAVENGVIIAKAPGTVTLTASAGSKSHVVNITVLSPTNSITLDKTSVTINKGQTFTLTPTITPANSTDAIQWSSSNTNIATVNSMGVVTGKSGGSCTITATCGSKSAKCNVTVTETCTSISLNASQVVLEKGLTYATVVTVLPSNCTDVIQWSSSNTNIATVNSNGVVTGKSGGSCTITATCGSKRASFILTVKVTTTAFSINETTLTLTKGGTKQLTYKLTPADSTEAIVWSSSNTSIATVSNGLVTAVKGGTATISATSGSHTSHCSVTVSSPCKGISFTSSSLTFSANARINMRSYLVLTPADCSDKISWYVDNYNLGTITSDGVLTLANGSGTFHVQAQCGGYAATITIYFK